MKFKVIFIFFNILFIASFAIILFLPFFMLGWGYVKVFWTENWYLAAIFIVVLVTLNTYFLCKRKLFSLLESENWKEACGYLEQRVYEKNSSSRQIVRILINTYIVLADIEGLAKLSAHLAEKKPRLFRIFALELGLPHIVRNDSASMQSYFEEALKDPKVQKKDWLRWNLAFARMAGGRHEDREKARSELVYLAEKSKDPVLRLLAVYLLDKAVEKDDSIIKLTAGVCSSLKREYTREAWEKTVSRAKSSLIVLILSKLLEEAEAWLFEEKNDGRI